MNNPIKDKIIQLAEKYDVAAFILENGHHKQHPLNFSKFADEVIATLGNNHQEIVAHQRYTEEKGWIAVATEDIEHYKGKSYRSSIIHRRLNQVHVDSGMASRFLSTGEGENGEVSIVNRDGKSSYDELCEEEVVAIMQGTLEHQPSITEHIKK